MPGVTSTVLSDRLLELEDEGLISKKFYSEIPPRVECKLTTRTRELKDTIAPKAIVSDKDYFKETKNVEPTGKAMDNRVQTQNTFNDNMVTEAH